MRTGAKRLSLVRSAELELEHRAAIAIGRLERDRAERELERWQAELERDVERELGYRRRDALGAVR